MGITQNARHMGIWAFGHTYKPDLKIMGEDVLQTKRKRTIYLVRPKIVAADVQKRSFYGGLGGGCIP